MSTDAVIWNAPAETEIPFIAVLSALFPLDDAFETDIARFLGAGQCVCADNGRALLSLILDHLGQKDRGSRTEVLIPGYTCYSVAASVVRSGFALQVYDIDPHTLGPVMKSVEDMLGDKTLAVVGQHLFGLPTPVRELAEMAHEAGVLFIEDAAQGLGGTIQGKPLGMTGDYGLFSFGRGKPLPLGCGGALVGEEVSRLKDMMPRVSSEGIVQLFKTAATRLLANRFIYGFMEALPIGLGTTVFDPGFSVSCMPTAMKRLGKRALAHLDTLNEHRRMIADVYDASFTEKWKIPRIIDSLPVFTRYPVLAGASELSRGLLQKGVRRMYPRAILHEPSISPYLTDDIRPTPGASFVAENLITLPTHSGISVKEAEEIAKMVNEVYA